MSELRMTFLIFAMSLSATVYLAAQDTPRAGGEAAGQPATKQANPMAQAQQLQEQVKNLGFNWSVEAMRIQEAHQLVFQQNGWTSESDTFALSLVNQISNIEPWNTQQREAVFLDGCRDRFGLGQDQVELLHSEMRRESMAFTMKHLNKIMPVAMEAVQARVQGKPFTPEMVQKWSQQLEPLMDEALASVKRVQGKLEATMDETQKAKLRKDMDAVLKRHHDLARQVGEWKQGKWTPYAFGLQNDPVYAGEMHKYAVPATLLNNPSINQPTQAELFLEVTRRDPSMWEKYVLDFVAEYECDEKQRGQALAILKESEADAMRHLMANGDDLAHYEERAKQSPSEKVRAYNAKKAEALRRPVEQIFTRMCKRLENNVLNREQRLKLADQRKANSKPGARSGRGSVNKTARADD